MNGPQPHIVTLDVNIYLTVARKLEPGFTDKQFMSCVSDAGQHDTDYLPCSKDSWNTISGRWSCRGMDGAAYR